MVDVVELKVVEWPQHGAAVRWKGKEGGVGWWVVEDRPGLGYTPIAGAFRRKDEADQALAELTR